MSMATPGILSLAANSTSALNLRRQTCSSTSVLTCRTCRFPSSRRVGQQLLWHIDKQNDFLLRATSSCRCTCKLPRRCRRWICRAGRSEVGVVDALSWVGKYQDKLRSAPLVAGGLGIAGLVLNRAISGAVGLDASSVESRTDVLIILMSAVLLLTGLQWLALKPVVKEAVEMDGKSVDYRHASLPAGAKRELQWMWRAMQSSTRCRGLMIFYRGDCIARFGLSNPSSSSQEARMGPISEKAIQSGRGNYLANLALYPGRVEFTGNFPVNTQGVVIQPIGQDGVLLAATDMQRGFGRLDQAWIALLAEKLDSTLDGFVPSGKGFNKQAAEVRQ